MSTLSGYHDRTIFSVDWSKHNLIATGKFLISLCLFCCEAKVLISLRCCLECLEKLQSQMAGFCMYWLLQITSRDNTLGFDVGSQDNGVRIFTISLPEKTPERTLRGSPVIELLHHNAAAHTSDVNCVRWHPTKPQLLASTSDDNSLRIWNVNLPEKS